jgi:dCTP deaminase
MILTGSAIDAARTKNEITIYPYRKEDLNPNSYNYRLGETIVSLGDEGEPLDTIAIERSGIILEPKKVYLGVTEEIIGSEKYVMLLLGRSSIGRLGLFLNITADLGHLGSCSRWTLELRSIQRLRVYPGMKIGQVSFWVTNASTNHYRGLYHGDSAPIANRDTQTARRFE